MKKLLFILAVALTVTSCGNSATTETKMTDSTSTVTDTTKTVVTDSTTVDSSATK
jgi:hypothetical protein